MVDYAEGIKRDVAEIKFLIHDLRVKWFFNEVIHYHVTLDTDLEIHGVEQAQALHGADLDELKDKAREVRKRHREYSSAVENFSPDKTVLRTGRALIQAIADMCELILNPLWGRIDRVLAFLPPDSRSVRTRSHYRNCIRWICGVSSRLEHFRAEQGGEEINEEFDIAEDLQEFTRNVAYGYAVERSAARVELRLDRLDRAILSGRRHRFRRMFFSLIMNAVDAMAGRKVGMINISDVVEGDRVALRVADNASGMPPEKIEQLLADKESLDGELHSLGFVFVRQTVAEFGGTIEVESEVGKGTTITVRLPPLPDATPTPRKPSECEKLDLLQESSEPGLRLQRAGARERPPRPDTEEDAAWGKMILADYRTSDAPHPGCIFAIGVTEEGEVDYFTHRPYERLWNITHEDLSPMFFEATVRGRLEQDEEGQPVLILKAPLNMREFFEFKELPEEERSAEAYVRMVHDEFIRVARKLMASGMEAATDVYVTDVPKLFSGHPELLEKEPFSLEVLARQKLTGK
jgi:signal transduction histidine kinase